MGDETPNTNTTLETATTPEVVAKVGLEASIESAAEDALKAIKPNDEKQEVKATPKAETKADDKKETPKPETTQEETNQALLLYRALMDPAKGMDALLMLNKAAGLKIDSTPAEKKEVVKSVTDVIKEELGSDFEFISDKLSKAIEKAADLVVENKTKDIREAEVARKDAEQKMQIKTELETVVTKFNINDEVQKEMLSLMTKIRPGKDVTINEYFETLAHAAAANKGVVLSKDAKNVKQEAETKARVDRNRNDANSRLASEKGASVKSAIAPPAKMGLRDAVQAAHEAAMQVLEK